MLIATEQRAVKVLRRGVPRWTYQWYGPGEEIELESLGVRLGVDALYRLTDMPVGGPEPSAGAPA